MRPLFIECESCESTFQLKHDMSEQHYHVKYCTFCGEELADDNTLPPIKELFDDENTNDDTDDWETDQI